ncbi:ADR011Cp [Eremothecium gossypii ATCC 10895]|uniref:ATP-dependent DNA helicase MPH1 n=1 Tax=Eremothecium gossypii (strain ATCC 10895 / CBS 109.51 / FGSC 9923 / NRRL Y-1056) TaxID=284811 RepID=MPH1_EREGS|nr:ADR011Cp [Eremothecium gossypii ATCC 10895]Q75AA7.2 RecName: Full=ATP-dependent DNA helicase MPH1; AltName: Full=FANCM-like protein 1 [Eremothecium gossypii ATCC 10895]AAS51931.2 ADR011Cp [Eremothecium gossypii ATCC 10895]AEY96231.1 FADR011Cp [Eremothecium gossypii FDAG1]
MLQHATITKMTDFSDLDDDDIVGLLDQDVNRCVETSVTRHKLAMQRDLTGKVLDGEKRYYEEVVTSVTYKPTHHQLRYENLNTYLYPTNYEVREYQFNIVHRALFENVLCAIPTGMGKTFIASTVMLNYYRWTVGTKIIFTAPTRPLVAQQIKACLGITGIPYNDTAILLDKSRKHREQIWSEKRVFFATPQVVENDLKRGALNPKDVVLLVIDEAHRARGSYAYVELTKFIDRFNTSYRVLALTATPATDLEGVQEVVDNLQISKIELRTEESEDIVRYMKRRDTEEVIVPLIPEIEDIIEQLGIAITPVLKEAVQLGLYDDCEPVNINAFIAMQQSQKILANSSIPEGVKWKNYFILQLLCHVGHMLKRLKIYGIQTFYTYFDNKYREFTTKYGIGKSTNKTAASFYYSSILKNITKTCQAYTANPSFLGHGKLYRVRDELSTFFASAGDDSRVIIFTELRESALELVKCVDNMNDRFIRPHIFIGQAKGKESFDDGEYLRKHAPKGRKKVDRIRRLEEEKRLADEKLRKKEEEKLARTARRTGSSEEAQISGMTQKQQKEVISLFKKGDYNVLVCTSIGEEGLDIGEVDMIICYDTTSSPIKNIQRMGRTGRKRDGRIVLLLSDNEPRKFEQAMEDYAQLQRLIGEESLNYKVTDRIIPKGINPQCQKEFITISEKNSAVNGMEDADSVIKYATQAMLGKLDKRKAVKKSTGKAAPKRFFMPDDVETGIVPAMKLVKSYKYTENGEAFPVAESVKGRRPKSKDTLLDRLEYDSLESELSSPEKATKSQNVVEIRPKLLSDILLKDEDTLHFEHSSSCPKVDSLASVTTLSSDNKSTPDQLKRSQSDNGFGIPPKRQRLCYDTSANCSSTDTHLMEAQSKNKDNPANRKTGEPHYKLEVSPLKREEDDRDVIPQNIAVKPEVPHLTQECLTTGRVYKSEFSKYDGFLTVSERRYFEQNYSPVHLVSLEPRPVFSRSRNRVAIVPHSERVQRLINIFAAMDTDDKVHIIDMHRKHALARRTVHGGPTENSDLLQPSSDGIIVPNDDIRLFSLRPRATDFEDMLEDDEGLSELLDSD